MQNGNQNYSFNYIFLQTDAYINCKRCVYVRFSIVSHSG